MHARWRSLKETDARPLSDAWLEVSRTLNGRKYIRRSEAARLKSDAEKLRLPSFPFRSFFFSDADQAWRRLDSLLNDWDARIVIANKKFVAAELERHSAWFDRVCGYPLTQKQREAAVTDEDRLCVVAGAGTGKTSTVVGKCLYLLTHQGVPPENLLVLAFNSSAAEEIGTRLVKAGHPKASARTFHALGLSALASRNGAKPSLHPLSAPENPNALAHWFQDEIDRLIDDPRHSADVLHYLASHMIPFKPRTSFATDAEFIRHIASLKLRTLKGERVKSMGELVIANFLLVNGISYTYEAKYHIPTATIERRQYKPDFKLDDHGIYIEYFGVDRAGRTMDHVDRTDYAEGMRWKRDLHKKNGGTLIELFAYDLFENKLTERLASQLQAVNIPFRHAARETLGNYLEKEKPVTRLAALCANYLKLYKANHADRPLEEFARPGDYRQFAFQRVFKPLYEKYQHELASSGDIDFNDMTVNAAEAIKAGFGPMNVTHLIVDEFQDLSVGRKKILDAILAANPQARLFCVGDDWQSIYRFTGSDIGMMTRFAERFSNGVTISLDKVFRYSQELISVSSRFIEKNPHQLKKSLISEKSLGSSPVELFPDTTNALQDVLDGISSRSPGASVLLLGRYNFDELPYKARNLKVQFLTVHRAKGLEADFVVILNGRAGEHGFPSEIVTDPILNPLFPPADDTADAEERRLFYVALTRARKQVYYLVDQTTPSSFAEELAESSLVRRLHSAGRICPKCGALLVERKNRESQKNFWGCANYPSCDHTEPFAPPALS